MARTSENWHNLAPEVKDKYQTEWKQLNEIYTIELRKWKENMVQTDQSKSKSERNINKRAE